MRLKVPGGMIVSRLLFISLTESTWCAEASEETNIVTSWVCVEKILAGRLVIAFVPRYRD